MPWLNLYNVQNWCYQYVENEQGEIYYVLL